MSTTTTTLNDIIGGAAHAKALAVHVAEPVAMKIAWMLKGPPGSNGTMVLPRYALGATNAGSKTENATYASQAVSTDGVTVTGAMVGHRSPLSWEANTFAVESAFAGVVEVGKARLYRRVDTDLMTVAAAATNSTDLATADLTEADAQAFLAAYNAQIPHAGEHALVLYPYQIATWTSDLFTNGGAQLGGDAESARVASLSSPGLGFKGIRHGFRVFESSNVVVAAGEASGFGCKMGDQGALALVSWREIQVQSEWLMAAAGWDVVVDTFYGVAISDPANIRSLISASA